MGRHSRHQKNGGLTRLPLSLFEKKERKDTTTQGKGRRASPPKERKSEADNSSSSWKKGGTLPPHGKDEDRHRRERWKTALHGRGSPMLITKRRREHHHPREGGPDGYDAPSFLSHTKRRDARRRGEKTPQKEREASRFLFGLFLFKCMTKWRVHNHPNRAGPDAHDFRYFLNEKGEITTQGRGGRKPIREGWKTARQGRRGPVAHNLCTILV